MVHSIVLYGAPVWYSVLRIRKYEKLVTRVQRKMLLRVVSAYRTASAAALQVIAGVIPIDLLAEERKKLHDSRRELGIEDRNEIRNAILIKWQDRWDANIETAQWTKNLSRI